MVGFLPLLPISRSTTAFGRDMIELTRDVVETTFTIKNGYPADATVIYGDTDSVMVEFGVETVKEAMAIGAEAAALVTQRFVKPINLEFEKVYFPYLLISRKRYAGVYWTNAEKYDKLDCKGIEVYAPSQGLMSIRRCDEITADLCGMFSASLLTCC